MTTVARWRPGTHYGLAWDGGVALLEPSLGSDVADALWRELHAHHPDLAGFFTTLGDKAGVDLMSLPSFSVALLHDGVVHVAVRGDFAATSGSRLWSGQEVVTWAEPRLTTPCEVTMSVAGAVSTDFPHAAASGTFPAEALTVRLACDERAVEVPLPPPVSSEQPQADNANHAAEMEESEAAPQAGPDSQVPLARTSQLWGDLTILGTRSAVDGDSAGQVSPDSRLDGAPAAPEDDITRVGATPSTGTEPSKESNLPEAGPDMLPSAGVMGDASGTETWSPRPRFSEGDPLSENEESDDDGDTIIRHAPREVTLGSQVSKELVPARVCDVGHPNPPEMNTCRLCGTMLSAEMRDIIRPSLGRLVTSDGTSIDLVGPVVIGREPHAARFQGTQAPGLLRLDHAHVPANHIEVRLDGWAVFASDLRSTNGTYVRRTGHPPQRLTDAPVALAPGDVLDLGHGVAVTMTDPS